MSGVPPTTRINLADLKGAPQSVVTLAKAQNALVDYLTQTLGKGVTIGQNLAGNLAELEVRTVASYSSGEPMAVRFKLALGNQRANGVLVFKVTDLDFPNAVLAGPFECSTWEQQGDEILVRWITGLEASHRYFMRFWVAV